MAPSCVSLGPPRVTGQRGPAARRRITRMGPGPRPLSTDLPLLRPHGVVLSVTKRSLQDSGPPFCVRPEPAWAGGCGCFWVGFREPRPRSEQEAPGRPCGCEGDEAGVGGREMQEGLVRPFWSFQRRREAQQVSWAAPGLSRWAGWVCRGARGRVCRPSPSELRLCVCTCTCVCNESECANGPVCV